MIDDVIIVFVSQHLFIGQMIEGKLRWLTNTDKEKRVGGKLIKG